MNPRLENELLRRRFSCTNAVYRRVWPHLYMKRIYLQIKTFGKHTEGCDHVSIQQVCWSLSHEMQYINLDDQQDVITAGARMFPCHFTGLTGHLLWLRRDVFLCVQAWSEHVFELYPLHKLRLLHRFCRAGIHSGSSEDEDVNILGVPSEVVSSDPEESHGSVRSGSWYPGSESEPSHGPHPHKQSSGPHLPQYNDPAARLLRQCLRSVSSVIPSRHMHVSTFLCSGCILDVQYDVHQKLLQVAPYDVNRHG